MYTTSIITSLFALTGSTVLAVPMSATATAAAGSVPSLPATAQPGQSVYDGPITNQTAFYLSVEYLLRYNLANNTYTPKDLYNVSTIRQDNATTGKFRQAVDPSAIFYSTTFQPSQNRTLTSLGSQQYPPVYLRDRSGSPSKALLPLDWHSMAVAPVGFVQAIKDARMTITNPEEKLVSQFDVVNFNTTADPVRKSWPSNQAWYCFRTYAGGPNEFSNKSHNVAQIFVGSEKGIFRISTTNPYFV